ncbi:MAG: ABC transporter permease [Egibacteraceae bacterium]
MKVGLVKAEIDRLARRPRFWLVLLGVVGASAIQILRHAEGLDGQLAWWAVLREWLNPLHLLLPLLVSVLVGSSVVEDRAAGFVRLVTARSVSRISYVAGKFIGAAIVLIVALGCSVVALGLLAWIVGPAEGTAHPNGVPFVAGFPRTGLGIVLTVAAITTAGAVLYTAFSVFVSMVTKNVYVVTTLPVLTHLTVMLTLSQRFPQLNPVENLVLEAPGLTPASVFAFWVGGAALLLGSALILAGHQEVLD